jgi:hypothetical protein
MVGTQKTVLAFQNFPRKGTIISFLAFKNYPKANQCINVLSCHLPVFIGIPQVTPLLVYSE